jgi:hypothetical protein
MLETKNWPLLVVRWNGLRCRLMLELYLIFKYTLTCVKRQKKKNMISAGLWENLKTAKSCQIAHKRVQKCKIEHRLTWTVLNMMK